MIVRYERCCIESCERIAVRLQILENYQAFYHLIRIGMDCAYLSVIEMEDMKVHVVIYQENC